MPHSQTYRLSACSHDGAWHAQRISSCLTPFLKRGLYRCRIAAQAVHIVAAADSKVGIWADSPAFHICQYQSSINAVHVNPVKSYCICSDALLDPYRRLQHCSFQLGEGANLAVHFMHGRDQTCAGERAAGWGRRQGARARMEAGAVAAAGQPLLRAGQSGHQRRAWRGLCCRPGCGFPRRGAALFCSTPNSMLSLCL